MYIDKIENLKNYIKDQDLLKAVLDFLKTAKSAPKGRNDILGETYANVIDYTTKPFTEIKMEVHRAFVDLQCVVSGEEKLLKQDISMGKAITEYDEEKDYAFHAPETFDSAILNDSNFAILYPNDLHQCVAADEPINIRKIVFKIPVGLI
ncbi:MAG: YhcH/YjgK/YiaL family protein [Clostridia bacterium]|nr:YhcH/YjgK/YiaL family protein [Clostridia bacterium]